MSDFPYAGRFRRQPDPSGDRMLAESPRLYRSHRRMFARLNR